MIRIIIQNKAHPLAAQRREMPPLNSDQERGGAA
jgi:hypothetical protein